LQVDLDLGEEARPERVALEVRSHDADEVWAVADVSGPGAAGVSFRLERDDTGVRVYGRAGGLLSWLFGGPSVQLRVFVPREFSVDLRSASGLLATMAVGSGPTCRSRGAPRSPRRRRARRHPERR
jgi:hypothetical protein